MTGSKRSPSQPLKPASVALIVAVLAACSSGRLAQRGGAPLRAETIPQVEHIAEALHRENRFSGVVLLSHRGRPLVRRAYGFADRNARRADTPETAFALASVSKMFTAVLVAQLIERGRIRTDDTIGSLLPHFPAGEARSQVTIHHLLTMSSGIPDVWALPRFWEVLPNARAVSDFWPVFATAPLDFTPGARYVYSNSNCLVLGAVVERGFGDAFSTVAERQIFRTAGMTQTTYREPKVRPARGYTRRRPEGASAVTPDADGWYAAFPDEPSASDEAVPANSSMGGGYSTVDDLARFAEALMQGRLLNRQTTRRVMTGYVPDHTEDATAMDSKHGS